VLNPGDKGTVAFAASENSVQWKLTFLVEEDDEGMELYVDDVTKLLLKTGKRQPVHWHWHMQDFVNDEVFCPFIEEPENLAVPYHPGNLFKLAASQSPPKICRSADRRCRKNCDASTNQSNNFGVSRKRFKPSTTGSKFVNSVYDVSSCSI